MLNDSCRAHALTGREAVPLPCSKYELFNPIQLGLKATAATWPPQWREMVQGFVSAFPSMAWLAVSKAQAHHLEHEPFSQLGSPEPER